MPLEIVRNDITKMDVDVIVNAANKALKIGGGVCGAIFQTAGVKELQKACEEIGFCDVGQAVMTDGFQLQAKKVIHTVGPIWKDGQQNEAEFLKASYANSLALAASQNYDSIAFPLISTGIYGYPKAEALQIAVSTISSFLLANDMQVYLVVFDKKSFKISAKLFTSIHEYIDEYYVEEIEERFQRGRQLQSFESPLSLEAESFSSSKRNLEDVMKQLGESFSERLFRLIDEKGMTDVETYKKANMDRRLFSKIRNTPNYTPLKKTVIAFAIALELNLDETLDLLSKAGYTLTPSSKFDLIVEFFIEEENYNIYEINEALFAFDQVLLGG
ncbi:macro domain-containing protein [Psychrobacillus sp. NPDC096623]|uniref:macro domain-containing protein n=1 Tax=Psychrobacillus sp. NPDC096623 TaxID=3364492 RepID=UPI003819F857